MGENFWGSAFSKILRCVGAGAGVEQSIGISTSLLIKEGHDARPPSESPREAVAVDNTTQVIFR